MKSIPLSFRLRSIPSLLVALTLVCASSASPAQIPPSWIHDSFEDFSAGKLDAAGQNLYVAREGTIEAIRRYDLNNDGWIDLVFQATHDFTFDPPATVGTIAEGKVQESPALDIKGSFRVELNDLNRDGYLDAVFCPNDNWVDGRRFLTIAWGGPNGWDASRTNGVLPVQNARRLSVDDFDGDGWPDIAVLCGPAWLRDQPSGNIVRIYWGSQDGFLLPRRTDLGLADAIEIQSLDKPGGTASLAVLTKTGSVQIYSSLTPSSPLSVLQSQILSLPDKNPISLAAADLDADGGEDLLIGTRADTLYIAYGASEAGWNRIKAIAACPASTISVGDLDGDGRIDLVLSHYETRFAGYDPPTKGNGVGEVSLLWGGEDGFVIQPLPLSGFKWVTASAVGDLNGDSRPDLVFARNHSDSRYSSETIVLINTGDRHFTRLESGLLTTGAADVAIAPAENKRAARVVVANAVDASTLDEKCDSSIYWGGPKGFTATARQIIPETSGFQTVAADLNADGHVDLIAPYFGHSSEAHANNPYRGINIFWGGQDGFDPVNKRTTLPEYGLLFTNVADLNRDGWLDIVAGQHHTPNAATPEVIIYYGGPTGFSADRRMAIPSPGRSVPIVIADMNNDEWLDLVVGSRLGQEHKIRIFHGGPNGFSDKNQQIIPFFDALDLEVADLNSDGHLDLIASVRADDATPPHTDLGAWIFWGGGGSYRQANAQWLPGSAILGITAADFDHDGYLDLMMPSYHGGASRDSLRHFLYWGGPKGYSTRNRTEFFANAAADCFAADFNQDGLLDFCLVVHTSDEGHFQDSKVFLNDGRRFQNTEIQAVPAVGPHWMWGSDMGHIYNRRWDQIYVSSDLLWRTAMTTGHLAFEAKVPQGASLGFEMRSASDSVGLKNAKWRSLDRGNFSLQPLDRVLQYRAVFRSPNGDAYPALQRVEIKLGSGNLR